MSYPHAPWQLHGTMWVSVFWLGRDRHPTGGSGPVGVAWVDYRDPSPLVYEELLVGAVVRRREGPRLQVEVTDIWVDSPESLAGGRELWAIPKDLGAFSRVHDEEDRAAKGPSSRARSTRWSMQVEGHQVASASFRDLSAAAPRVPYRFATQQRWPEGHPRAGATVIAPVRGSARALPCRARWSFEPDGPLGALDGARPVASLCLEDFALSFG